MTERLELQLTEQLKNAFGQFVEMTDEAGHSRVLSLIAEFRLDDRAYAVLLPEGAQEPEQELYRIVGSEAEGWELETIEDDDEWEEVAELYDELTYRDEF